MPFCRRPFSSQMSPDRGQQEFHPPASMRTYFDAQEKSTDVSDYGDGLCLVKNGVVPDADTHRLSNSLPRTSQSTSHIDRSYKDESATTGGLSSRTHAAVSVRSVSSTENSRRDSAISAGSQHRRRPKTSRSNSKRSLQSSSGHDMTRTTSRGCPSRPRGHRIASSTSIPMPHTNIEEALALHARSCEIFSGTSRPSTAYSPAISPYGSRTQFGHYRSLSSADALPTLNSFSQPGSPYSGMTHQSTYDVADEEDQYFSTSFPPTVMHWTSDETRMQEYAAIDRSNTGMRGLLKRLLPKCVSKGHGKFYDEKDGSDAGSVRRIRLDFPMEKEEPRRSNMPRQFSMSREQIC